MCVQSTAASLPFERSGHPSDTDILRRICDQYFPQGLCPLYVQKSIVSNTNHLAFMRKVAPGSTSYQNRYVD